MIILNGEKTKGGGEARVERQVGGILERKRCWVGLLVYGVYIILWLGGVSVGKDGTVSWSRKHCEAGVTLINNDCPKMKIEKNDFAAAFDDFAVEFDDHQWKVEWEWQNGEPLMSNWCARHAVLGEYISEHEAGLEQWVADGWVELHNPEVHGDVDGVIPLMAASQPNKHRQYHPVMDYQELNRYIESKPGQETVACYEKLCEWRRHGTVASLVDLRKYLQAHISNDLQRIQTVKYKDQL